MVSLHCFCNGQCWNLLPCDEICILHCCKIILTSVDETSVNGGCVCVWFFKKLYFIYQSAWRRHFLVALDVKSVLCGFCLLVKLTLWVRWRNLHIWYPLIKSRFGFYIIYLWLLAAKEFHLSQEVKRIYRVRKAFCLTYNFFFVEKCNEKADTPNNKISIKFRVYRSYN